MTRAQIDTGIFTQQATSGKAALVADPANAFVTQVITNLNNISTDLDTASIPATTGSIETITSGAASITIPRTNLSTTGTVAYTLADGVTVGMVKTFECTVAATSPKGTLTIATPLSGEPATHVFNATSQLLELIWQTGGWHIIRKRRAGKTIAVVGATALTGFDLNTQYDLSITGTVTSTSTMALPDPTVGDEGISIIITCSTAATCPAGTLDGTYSTTGNANATHLAVNATTDTANFTAFTGRWHALLLTSTALT